MRKILVLRGGALGDFIVTLPALALLRRRWPDARIELAGNVTAAGLALNRGLIDAAHSQHEARWSALYQAALPEALADWLATFDLVVSWWPDSSGELHRNFPRHPAQRFLSGAALPSFGPAAAHYCGTLQPLDLTPSELLFRLTAEPVKRIGTTIHPGSGSPRKNWPRERWLELASGLPEPVTLILGEAELNGDDWPAPAGVNVLRQRPLEDLAAHLATCRLFLGHDSGISHLAAACGASCVLLFGPTDPSIWAPPSPHVRVLRHGPTISSISIADVRAALEASA